MEEIFEIFSLGNLGNPLYIFLTFWTKVLMRKVIHRLINNNTKQLRVIP